MGCICFIGWSAAWHIVFILILSALKLLRVSDEVEEKGLDYEYCKLNTLYFFFKKVVDQHFILNQLEIKKWYQDAIVHQISLLELYKQNENFFLNYEEFIIKIISIWLVETIIAISRIRKEVEFEWVPK